MSDQKSLTKAIKLALLTLPLVTACTGGDTNDSSSSDAAKSSSSVAVSSEASSSLANSSSSAPVSSSSVAESSSSSAASSAPAPIVGNAAAGEIVFAQEGCINCHGDLENNERNIWRGTTTNAVLASIQNIALMAGYRNNSADNGTSLSDQQVADLAAYITQVVAMYGGGQPEQPIETVGKPTPLARLTNYEFVNSLRDLLALPQNTPNLDASFTSLPPESDVAGLASDSEQQLFSESILTGLATVADAAISDLISGSPDIISALSCDGPTPFTNDGCIQSYAEGVAQRAYGRPLTSADVTHLANIITLANNNLSAAGTNLDSNEARELKLRTLLGSILISPEFLFFVEQGETSENLAFGKTATQSTTEYGGVAARAVDGNRSGNFGDLSTTHTTESSQPWWRVDLGSVNTINEIVIANRTGGAAGDRLIGAKVYVGNTNSTNPSDYTEVGTLDNTALQTLSNLDARGQYVMVQHESELAILSLSEVEVYSEASGAGEDVSGSQLSSNEIGKRLAYFLTGTTPDAQLAAAAQNGSLLDPQVRAQHIDRLLQSPLVADNYLKMISGWFGISASHASASDIAYLENFIRDWINNNGTYADLYTAGVQVQESGVSSNVNIALGRPAEQSSTGFDGIAARAVDGNTAGAYAQNSVTHTLASDQPWWRVDLGSTQNIGQIIIFNRTGGATGDRLIGAKVYVGNNPTNNPADYTEVGALTSDASQTLANLSASGRYVMVKHDITAALSLAEVEIYPRSSSGTHTVNAGVIGTHAYVNSHTSFPTPAFINRGDFVVSRLTCADLPEDVPAEAFDVENYTSVELFNTLPGLACATCHHIFDNYGAHFQQYDEETGFYSPNRKPFGTNFSLFEIGDIFGSLDGSVEALGSTLANSESATNCFSGLFYRHAFRRSLDENDGDASRIEAYVSDWKSDNNSGLKSLLRIIALSDSFITLYE